MPPASVAALAVNVPVKFTFSIAAPSPMALPDVSAVKLRSLAVMLEVVPSRMLPAVAVKLTSFAAAVPTLIVLTRMSPVSVVKEKFKPASVTSVTVTSVPSEVRLRVVRLVAATL